MNITDSEQYLTFGMDHETYAIPVAHIREVLLVPKMTKIPQMPEYMRGVINLRGSVVPLIDLRLKFGLGETELTQETAIIVIEIPYTIDGEKKMHHIGLYVDSVVNVITIGQNEIEPPPRIGTAIRTLFIRGIGNINGSFVVILNIKEILTDQDFEVTENMPETETVS